MSFRIEHRIGVAAPAEAIWNLVFDVERWPEWNPLYPEARGRIAIGETLQLNEAFPAWKTRTIQPTIVDWEPNNQIIWRTNGVLARCVRYLEIEALAETGCIFANGAFWHGLIGGQEAKANRRAIYSGYEALGQAVKQLAEDGWRQRAAAQ